MTWMSPIRIYRFSIWLPILVPIALIDGQERLGYVAPPASFIGVLVVAQWIARKAPQRAVLHGLLVGLVAMLIYIPVELAAEITFAHVLSSVNPEMARPLREIWKRPPGRT